MVSRIAKSVRLMWLSVQIAGASLETCSVDCVSTFTGCSWLELIYGANFQRIICSNNFTIVAMTLDPSGHLNRWSHSWWSRTSQLGNGFRWWPWTRVRPAVVPLEIANWPPPYRLLRTEFELLEFTWRMVGGSVQREGCVDFTTPRAQGPLHFEALAAWCTKYFHRSYRFCFRYRVVKAIRYQDWEIKSFVLLKDGISQNCSFRGYLEQRNWKETERKPDWVKRKQI